MGLELFEPTQDSQCAERVPAAGFTDRFGERERESFVVGFFEQPAAVGLAFAFNELDGLGHAWIGPGARGAEVVESAENVVVVAGRESEFEEFRVGDLAGGFAVEQGAIEEIFFGAVAGGSDFDCVILRLRFD